MAKFKEEVKLPPPPEIIEVQSVTRMAWFEAFKIVEPYVAKIITPQGTGSGFFLGCSENQELIGIATAAHVVGFPHYWEQPIRIEHFKSNKTVFLNHPERLIDVDYQHDIASIIIGGDLLPDFPKEPIPLIAEKNILKVGAEIGWSGFPGIAPNNLCFFSGSISCWVRDAAYYLVDGVAINGVSGGPAYYVTSDHKVGIVGVVSAYIPNQATGAQLPGLSVVRDVRPLYKVIKNLKSFGEEKEREKAPEAPRPPQASSGEPTRS